MAENDKPKSGMCPECRLFTADIYPDRTECRNYSCTHYVPINKFQPTDDDLGDISCG